MAELEEMAPMGNFTEDYENHETGESVKDKNDKKTDDPKKAAEAEQSEENKKKDKKVTRKEVEEMIKSKNGLTDEAFQWLIDHDLISKEAVESIKGLDRMAEEMGNSRYVKLLDPDHFMTDRNQRTVGGRIHVWRLNRLQVKRASLVADIISFTNKNYEELAKSIAKGEKFNTAYGTENVGLRNKPQGAMKFAASIPILGTVIMAGRDKIKNVYDTYQRGKIDQPEEQLNNIYANEAGLKATVMMPDNMDPYMKVMSEEFKSMIETFTATIEANNAQMSIMMQQMQEMQEQRQNVQTQNQAQPIQLQITIDSKGDVKDINNTEKDGSTSEISDTEKDGSTSEVSDTNQSITGTEPDTIKATQSAIGKVQGAIDKVQSVVESVQDTIETKPGAMGAVQGAIGAAQGAVGAAQGTIGAAHGAIGAKQGAVGAMIPKIMSLNGVDSGTRYSQLGTILESDPELKSNPVMTGDFFGTGKNENSPLRDLLYKATDGKHADADDIVDRILNAGYGLVRESAERSAKAENIMDKLNNSVGTSIDGDVGKETSDHDDTGFE